MAPPATSILCLTYQVFHHDTLKWVYQLQNIKYSYQISGSIVLLFNIIN